jgi:predicted KAP-like P-loop ATPase
VLSDKPIESSADDLTNLTAFVGRLVKPLLLWPAEDSLVLALYGAWGQGKSSALNILYALLKADPAPGMPAALPIRFNPWLYGDAETLLLAFFGTLAKETGQTDRLSPRTRKALSGAFTAIGEVFVPLVATVSGLTWLNSLGKGVERLKELVKPGGTDVYKERERASRILREIATGTRRVRVVVLMDDLDRLDASEVRTTLKLVKLLADLPNISYVLSMDPARVARVLSTGGEFEYGQSFLEKIVQVPVHLPAISPERMRSLLHVDVHQLLPGVHIEPSESGAQEVEFDSQTDLVDYEGTLGKRITTLRDRARFLNNLRFLVQSGDQSLDVHAADLILLSLLQTFYPHAYERVRRRKRFLTGLFSVEDALIAQARSEEEIRARRLAAVNEIATGLINIDSEEQLTNAIATKGVDRDEVEIIRRIIGLLFPHAVTGRTASDQEEISLRNYNRIESVDRFDRYFQLQPPPDEPTDEEIDTLFDHFYVHPDGTPSSPDSSLVEAFLNTDRKLPTAFMRKLRDRVAHLQDPILLDQLFGYFLARQDLISAPQFLSLTRDTIKQAAALRVVARSTYLPISADELHSALALPEKVALRAVGELAESWSALLLAAELARTSPREGRFAEPTRIELAAAGLQRMHVYLIGVRDLFSDTNYETLASVIWRWRDLLAITNADRTQIASFLEAAVRERPELLPRVIALGAGWSNGPVFGARSQPEVRKSLDEIFGTDKLLQLAEEFLAAYARDTDPYRIVPAFVGYMQPDGSE